MIEDWRNDIVTNVLVQQRIEELDENNIWRRYFPEVAASEDEIAATERKLGFDLVADYRGFLRFANGWKCFWQYVDLFGTPQLLGASPAPAAEEILGAIEPEDFEAAVGMTVGDVLVVGASEVQTDLFLLAQPWSPTPGAAFWFDGEVIERCPNFSELYLTMVDYNRYRIQKMEEGGP